jgi:4'-phosphopantetheinyl transferase
MKTDAQLGAPLKRLSSAGDGSVHQDLAQALHVWLADPGWFVNRQVLQRFHGWISPDERQRYQSFHFPRDREAFLVAHGLLRYLLSHYSRQAPAGVRFDTGEHGRPELVQDRRGPQLRFNMSHTRGLIAWTFSVDQACGVDVEEVRDDVDIDELIEVVCSTDERQFLGGLTGRARIEQFYKMWCLKEALLKGCGLGLTDHLTSVNIRHVGEDCYRAEDPLCRVVGDAQWYLHGTACGSGSHALALAYESGGAHQPRIGLDYLVPDMVLADHGSGAALSAFGVCAPGSGLQPDPGA